MEKEVIKSIAKGHQKGKVNIFYTKPKRIFIILRYFSCFAKVRSMSKIVFMCISQIVRVRSFFHFLFIVAM